ncbi:nitrilase-related carbon-nitrogen hydrolase [Nocardia neocaledoniensis]|uniref:nitrilase-related carbon-nitrogen hydrolase n=1 Tax=Nocardia neocaledoniensis TaxID=236511 RepID=UPI00340D406D
MADLIRVAAVQAEPAWLQLAVGIEQTIGLIEDAAAGGAQLVAFPETFLPGYPWWLWLNAVDWGSEFRGRYLANAMTRGGPELRAIAHAARRTGMWVALGFAERADTDLFMTQVLVSPAGRMEFARKVRPTALERELFRAGTEPPVVYDTELGRIGMLAGADHLCPRRRVDLWWEQIHIAAWSGFTVYHEDDGAGVTAVNSTVSADYARASRAVVVAPTALVPMTGWEVVDARSPEYRLLSGGGGVARVLGPDGLDLVEPLPAGSAGVLFAEVELAPEPGPGDQAAEFRSGPAERSRRSPL